MSDELHFEVEDESRRGGVSAAVVVSAILHVLIIIFFIRNYRPVTEADRTTPLHYVELIRQNPQFTEAPGAKTKSAPLSAPFSDANRRASTPTPNGNKPTLRPGEGGFYTPVTKSGSEQNARARQIAQAESELSARPSQDQSTAPGATFTYHPSQASASTGIDWRNAIREVGKVASISTGQQGMDLSGQGGDKGFAESGPLSFETQWYDWGDYAQSMVSRIRVNWYNNMPQLIQTGLKGVVTIRFTIHRDGQITNIEQLSSSGHPPYDFAARKAIELSSPLNPLPKDFPNPSERVTCMFFYNQEPPTR